MKVLLFLALHALLIAYLLWLRTELGGLIIIGFTFIFYLTGLGGIRVDKEARRLGFIVRLPQWKTLLFGFLSALISLLVIFVYKQAVSHPSSGLLFTIVNLLILSIPALILAYFATLVLRSFASGRPIE
ncbi:MAG: hypothetical protein ABI700_28670 [Chloroflexota bacterium]